MKMKKSNMEVCCDHIIIMVIMVFGCCCCVLNKEYYGQTDGGRYNTIPMVRNLKYTFLSRGEKQASFFCSESVAAITDYCWKEWLSAEQEEA